MRTYQLSNPLAGSGSTPEAAHERAEIRPLQSALKKAKLYRGKVDGVFGAGTGRACREAKWRLGYPLRACLPSGGQALLDYLRGYTTLPLAYRLRRRARGYGLSREDRLRAEIVKWARWGVEHEPEIHYTMGTGRDDWLRYHAGALPLDTDCSGFVTACYRWAGANDPNGLGYRVVGYTGTLLDHGQTLPLSEAKPGDLVVWGWYPGHHTAVIVDTKNRSNPLLVSHGSERGPLLETLAAETAAQRRPYVIRAYV